VHDLLKTSKGIPVALEAAKRPGAWWSRTFIIEFSKKAFSEGWDVSGRGKSRSLGTISKSLLSHPIRSFVADFVLRVARWNLQRVTKMTPGTFQLQDSAQHRCSATIEICWELAQIGRESNYAEYQNSVGAALQLPTSEEMVADQSDESGSKGKPFNRGC